MTNQEQLRSEIQIMLESPEIATLRSLIPLNLHEIFDAALRLAFIDGTIQTYQKLLQAGAIGLTETDSQK